VAALRIEQEHLTVELSFWEKLGALSRGVSCPLSAITSVTRVDHARSQVRGLRAPGTGLPGVIALGSFRGRRWVDFAAAYRHDPGYVIESEGDRFRRLVVSSPPVAALDELVPS
jgi:hypothetical protein